MLKEKKPHIILKVFNRSGESEFSKIVTEENEANYVTQLEGLPEDEKGLIIYKKDEDHWLLITKRRVRFAYEGIGNEILLDDLKMVRYCKESFEAYSSKFILTDKNDKDYIVHFEKAAFEGMTQALFFLAN